MRRFLFATASLLALGGAARAGAVLHDATPCAAITYCGTAVTDGTGAPNGAIGFSALFANGGQLANTPFAGSFYLTDANGVANQYDDFAGIFVEVSNPPAFATGVTFVLRGTFNKGTNSFTRVAHVFCRAGQAYACTVTDLGGVTAITQEAPLPGVNPPPPPQLQD